MLEAIVALITALASITPGLVQLFLESKARKEAEGEAMVRRSLNELHAATDRVQSQPPMQ